MAEIFNYKSNKLLTGTSGDDFIANGYEEDYEPYKYHKGGSNVTINAGNGNDFIQNRGSKVTINAGDGDDYISMDNEDDNPASLIAINAGAGNDSVWNCNDLVTINTGDGNDVINSFGSQVIIISSTGNDTIYNNCRDETHYYNDSLGYGENVIFNYTSGDGNDIIYGFKADSTLSIGGGSYSSEKSGDDIIVTVGNGKISLIGAATLSSVNIVGNKGNSENETLLTVTDSTKSPVTVGSAVKTINASKRTKSIKITGNKLANSIVSGSGKDSLYGGNGNDTILGNAGNDKLYG